MARSFRVFAVRNYAVTEAKLREKDVAYTLEANESTGQALKTGPRCDALPDRVVLASLRPDPWAFEPGDRYQLTVRAEELP